MSRKSIGPVSSSSVWPRWFKAAASIFTLIVLTMLPRAAWAQRVKDDPNPDKPCVTKLGQTDTFYRVAFHPWCDLRELVRVFPLLDENGKSLPVQVQLRGIYENNKDRVVDGVKIRHTVMRGCVLEGRPSPHADQEEKEYCSGLVNYFAAPSNDSIAIIEVSRSKVLTHTEKLEALSASTCAALARMANPDKSALTALESCNKLGFASVVQQKPVEPSSVQSQMPNAPPTVSAQPQTQNVPANADASRVNQNAQTDNEVWVILIVVMAVLLGLAAVIFAALFFKERNRNMAPIKAEYDKRLEEIRAEYDKNLEEFKAGYDNTNEQLTLELSDERGKSARLAEELEESKKKTMPPVGQMQRDLDKAQQELADEKAKTKKLEEELATRSSFMGPVSGSVDKLAQLELDNAGLADQLKERNAQVDELKKSLNAIAGERNELQQQVGKLQGRIQELESKAPVTLSGLGNAELIEFRAKAADLENQLAGAEERVKQAKANLDKRDEELQNSEAQVAELAEENLRLRQTIENNGAMPSLVVVSVKGLEAACKRLEEELKQKNADLEKVKAESQDLQTKSAEEIQVLQAEANRLTTELEQVSNALLDKDDVIARVKGERDKFESDLGIVGAENAELISRKREQAEANAQLAQDKQELEGANDRLVREYQELQDKYKDLLNSPDPAKRAEISYAELTKGRLHDSTAKLSNGSAQSEPPSTAKLVSSLSSTQDGSLTPGETNPQVIAELPVSSPGLDPEQGLPPWSPRKEALVAEYMQDESAIRPRHAVQPPPPASPEEIALSAPSSRPPLDFAGVPGELLGTYLRNLIKEMVLKRQSDKNITLEVAEREDVYSFNAILNVPVVWLLEGPEAQREFGSPGILLDFQTPRCRRPTAPHIPTATPQARGV